MQKLLPLAALAALISLASGDDNEKDTGQVEESIAYLKYGDGSKEKLETILQPVIDEFEQMKEDLNG